jgi:transcriptional regulator with XRE-family HTH domain
MGKSKRVTQVDIARLCGIDQGSVSRILNKDTRCLYARETVERVFTIARENGYLHPSLVTPDRRRGERKEIPCSVSFRIVGAQGNVLSEGTAEIDNVSISGMLLKSIRSSSNVLPLEAQWFDVEVTSNQLQGFRARCRLVRLTDSDDALGLAVQYESMEPPSRSLLKACLD